MKRNLFVKVFVVFLFCAVCSVSVNAQNTFSKGDKVVNLGVGIGGWGFPISGSFEYGIKDNLFDDKSSLGISGYLGASFRNNYSYFYPSVRCALHYQLVDNLDTYAGLGIAIGFWSSKYWNSSDVYLSVPFILGGRYYFKDNMAGFAELGYGFAYLTLGISFKF